MEDPKPVDHWGHMSDEIDPAIQLQRVGGDLDLVSSVSPG